MSEVWIGFFLSIAVLLLVSRKDLSLSLFVGSIVLGIATIGVTKTAGNVCHTFATPGYVWFSLALGLFPILGSTLKETGAFDDLIQNLRMGKKAFLAFAAALIGLLPVPGGALLSAPIIGKVSGDLAKERSFVINIWYRHVLIMVYPIGPALLIPVKIANLNVYDVIPYLFPFFVLMVALGYVFQLRGVEDDIRYEGDAKPRKALRPIILIIMPLLIDYGIKSAFDVGMPDMVLFLAVLTTTALAASVGRLSLEDLKKIVIESRFWKFVLIMMSMFIFIDIFNASGVGVLISGLDVPPIVLCVAIGFLLAFVTGRTQLSASVVIPSYLVAASAASMPLPLFSATFVSIFLGYLISPLHPCISVSLEYFGVDLYAAIRAMLPQTMVALAITALAFKISV